MSCRVEITRLSRIILATDAVRNLSLGLLMVVFPDLWDTPTYNILADFYRLHFIGYLFVGVGLFCLYAAIKQGAHAPRRAFQASAVLTCFWLASFIATMFFGNIGAIRIIIPYAALLAIDFAFVATSVERNDQR